VGPEEIRLRPEVKRFAVLMEKILRENDHKEGWDHCDLDYLMNKLKEEFDEVWELYEEEKTARSQGDPDNFDPNEFCGECIDIANVCMMLVDNHESP
jgi:hypothetical protein